MNAFESAGSSSSAWCDRASLEEAIEERQLLVHYQPKVSLESGRLIGFEALVRWEHPARGLLNAGDFLPLADCSRLAIALGRWVLTQACHQMAGWNRILPGAWPLTINVNTSQRYLADECLIGDLHRILADSGLHPACLQLEISESSIVAEVETARVALGKLKAMHIGLEIDDFGTGPTSLRYLHKLPFDTLKIHRSFVKKLGMLNDSSAVITSILEIVRTLGMNAAAQGVETERQLTMLTALGCLRGQGYYFSRPIDAASATTLVRAEMQSRRSAEAKRLALRSLTLVSGFDPPPGNDVQPDAFRALE